jgi:hypothetical protein
VAAGTIASEKPIALARRRHVVGEHDGGRAARFARRRAERVHDRLGDVVGGGDLAAETVTVCSMPTASIAWCARLRCCVRDTAPQIATTGSPSVVAVKPVARFVGAGAAGDQHDARDAGEAADRGGHEHGVLLGAAGHELRRAGSPCTAASASKTGSIFAPARRTPTARRGRGTSTTRSAAREHRSRRAGAVAAGGPGRWSMRRRPVRCS